ncbi:alkaline phosphatase family protein [Halorubrum ezzemoulense]|uniref:alkaline phosphatase family protein n=1 Tax=Halorubrum ezzemoulense TaxID=337243 RepID=UPI00232C7B1B|nr:alkaline phosphatase family protein [Halorubrum ezzemoulense]MDB9253344.1 alkaline phosphatase family protein [Halorubrum ezzemoulense]MDB9256291.1 alkaline phosphatase family protein [Halorubrum ezzemoulense]MDB9277661.1 alkaline phosphatase family protein [Halorubrum ezzemoulense]
MTTVILGLDGAAFELIDDWIDSGDLPNLETLTEEGAAMDMQSWLPPVTCPNWRCYASGVNPGKLGVFWWEQVNRDLQSIEPTSSSEQFDGGEYWDLLDGKVSIINFPTGSPPSKVNGEFIAGGPGSEQVKYTHPTDLEEDLRAKYDYQVHPELLSQLSKDEQDIDCVDEIHRLIEQRFQVLEDRLESGEYELIHATVFYINVLHHFYWDREVVRTAWKIIDKHIGTLLNSDKLDHLFIMSDHGSNRIDVEFNINTWLEQNGYLVRQRGASDVMKRLGITQDRVRPLLNRFHIEWLLRRVVPSDIQDLLPDSEGRVKRSAKGQLINWEESTAIASGQGPLYVIADSQSKRQKVKQELQGKLNKLRDPEGNLVIKETRSAESVYSGPYTSDGPDILLDQAPNVHINGGIGVDDVFVRPDTWAGENKDTGMFISYGPEIDSETVLDDLRITDLAPTLLTLHDAPIPRDMDGKPRYEIFSEDSSIHSRSSEVKDINWIEADTQDTRQTDNAVHSRLSDLGYINE